MLRTLTTLLAVLVLALAGCGGDDDESGGSGSAATPTATATAESTPEATPEETPADDGGGGAGEGDSIEVASPEDGGLVFEPDTLTAQAGEIEITYDNPATVPHAFAIDGQDVETETITGSTATVTANLEPGEYTFFCPVDGHRAAGMEGTLTVE
jgi:plastocyanin